jgi:hypothetical protein
MNDVLMIDWKDVLGAFFIVVIVGGLVVYNWTLVLGLFWLVQPIVTPLVWYHVAFPGENDPTAFSLGSTLVVWVLSSILNIKTGNTVIDLHDWWEEKRVEIIGKFLKHDTSK